MPFPKINEIKAKNGYTTVFGGLNRNVRIGENENKFERNMSSDDFPLLSVRSPREGIGLENVDIAECCNVLSGEDVVESIAYKTGNEIRFAAFSDLRKVREPISVSDTDNIVSQAGRLFFFPEATKLEALQADSDKEDLGKHVILTKGEESEIGYPTTPTYVKSSVEVNTNHAKNKLTVVTNSTKFHDGGYQYSNVVYFHKTTGEVRNKFYFEKSEAKKNISFWGDYYALIGHGTSGAFISDNIALYDKITAVISGSSATVNIYKKNQSPAIEFTFTPSDSEGHSVETGIKADRYFQKRNSGRSTNELVIFDKGNATSTTGTNEYGREVLCNSSGIVTEIRKYGVGNSAIPEYTSAKSGFVVSGHGTASSWIHNNISVGNFIEYNTSNNYIAVYESSENVVYTKKPTNPANGMRWYDDITDQMYVYSEATGQWASVTSNYIAMSMTERSITSGGVTIRPNYTITSNGVIVDSWLEGFNENDAIFISGLSEEYDGSYVVEKIVGESLILNGFIPKSLSFSIDNGAKVELNRKIPKLDHVIESNNRLWGCYYGADGEGGVLNEIYCTALGSPENWYRYVNGISTDSWAATVGVDGAFTGAITYKGTPIFFKENSIIIVYGNYPSNFQLMTYNYKGVKRGCHKSLCICDEKLYYYSPDGFMCISALGGMPRKVDDNLGDSVYDNVVCGARKGKLYASCILGEDKEIVTFDTSNNIWHREDKERIVDFFNKNEMLYMINADGDVMKAKSDIKEKNAWCFETCDFGYDIDKHKYVRDINVRFILPIGSNATFYISYDDGEYEIIQSYEGDGIRPINMHLIPHRCDHYCIKASGKGDIKIISINRESDYSGS